MAQRCTIPTQSREKNLTVLLFWCIFGEFIIFIGKCMILREKKAWMSTPNLTLSGVYAYCTYSYKLANEKQFWIAMRPCWQYCKKNCRLSNYQIYSVHIIFYGQFIWYQLSPNTTNRTRKLNFKCQNKTCTICSTQLYLAWSLPEELRLPPTQFSSLHIIVWK